MGKVHKKRKKTFKKNKDNLFNSIPILRDYSSLVFLELHSQLNNIPLSLEKLAYNIKKSFWQFVPSGKYDTEQARYFLKHYLCSLEEQLEKILCKQSIAYWLHVYRRIRPGHICSDKSPMTVLLTRAIMEAAIQKYGHVELCDRVGFSKKVKEKEILRGALLRPELRIMLEDVKENNQLVLTNFGPEELFEFYYCERLAYEIWRTTSMLRFVGKGAALIVQDNPIDVYDERDDELAELIMRYDNRNPEMGVSATATVFKEPWRDNAWSGCVLTPIYNVKGATFLYLAPIIKNITKVSVFPTAEGAPNFIWYPYNLKEFYKAHQAFENIFHEKYGISLAAAIVFIGSLSCRVQQIMKKDTGQWYRYWQRGYEGPYTRNDILQNISRFLFATIKLLDLPLKTNQIDVAKVYDFFTLPINRHEKIGLEWPGPHSIILPCGQDRVFIDYAYITLRLYYLFHDLKPSDQNFKGVALENIVQKEKPPLPRKLSAKDSSKKHDKEIDASFNLGDTLVIVECRAFARSIGFEKGDPKATEYRVERIKKLLKSIDEKANWLAKHPEGHNYSLRQIRNILPIGVTPFKEYIFSLDPHYWLTDSLPRVMSPSELKEALEKGILAKAAKTWPNVVRL